MRKVTIRADEAGLRLDVVLARRFPELTRSRVAQLISDGGVGQGAVPIRRAHRRVAAGECYCVSPVAPVSPVSPVPCVAAARQEAVAAASLAVVYEDDDVVVVDKPAGLAVHGGPSHETVHVASLLAARYGAGLSTLGGDHRPGIVHRLDLESSGLLVAARHDAAHAALARQFKAHDVSRAYTAFVWGAPSAMRGVVTAPLARHRRARRRMAVSVGGRRAVTRWRRLCVFGGVQPCAARLLCLPHSGRTHQIRVHLASLGHAVIGDALYGKLNRRLRRVRDGDTAFFSSPCASAIFLPHSDGTMGCVIARQALHASALAFSHPLRGRRLRFRSPLPADLRALEQALRSAAGALEKEEFREGRVCDGGGEEQGE